MPRCGALSLLQKTPHYRGGPTETTSRLNVILRDLRDCLTAWWCLVGSYPLFYTEFKSRDSKIESRRGAGPFAGHSQLLVCASVLRSLPPATPPASPVAPALAPARGMLGRVLYAAAFFLSFLISAATAGGRTTVQPSAPPRRHCQRPQLVKGKSPQGSRVTVQIEQYLLCSAAQLTSCSFPAAAAASRLTSSMLPHASLGASQLLKPASTTP